MRNLLLCAAALIGVSFCWAQTPSPMILGAGNVNPFPLPVAPGQVLTLFVQPVAPNSPVSANGISATFGADQPMPIVQVVNVTGSCTPLNTACPGVLAVTVQVPFGISVFCQACASPFVSNASIAISIGGVKTPSVVVQPFQDQVHILTECDVIVAGPDSSHPLAGGLPCLPIVTHADGRTVSNLLPAKAGEELVAYATGLGETNPALTTGQAPAHSTPTVTAFGIDFNYRANALATQPGAIGAPTASPVFSGATQGYVGLYQINFIVPSPPAGLEPCVNNATLPAPFVRTVKSNLTVSVGSDFSFDGVGICVTP